MLEKILDSRVMVLYTIPFCLGLITVFSFQPFNYSIVNFILFPIFFLLLVNINKRSKSKYRKKPYLRNLFFIGIAFGFGFYLSNIFWISNSLTFDENLKIFIPFSIILIPLFLSVFYGVTTLIMGQFLNYNISSMFLFSVFISTADYIRGNVLTGFPWNLWAYSWSWLTEALQILNLVGLYAFNLLTITLFTLPAVIFFKSNSLKKITVYFTFFLSIFSIYIYGTYVINKNKGIINYLSNGDKLYTKVVSPNFELKYYTTKEEVEQKIGKLIKFSDPNKNYKTLFVWPEGVFAGYNFNDIYEFKNLIQDNFDKNHFIIFGVNTIDQDSGGYFNSLVVVNNKFEILHKYNKRKLVPFGEFLPLESMLSKFGLKKITEGLGSFSKGIDQKNIIINGLNILPLICYEIIFPELIQKTESETNLVVNISEDGWFGDTIGPHQHLAKAIFRAIENNTYLVRSANKGISAIISNKGEVLKKLDTFEAGNIEMNIPLINSENRNRNDLIFFILLFTYLISFLIFKMKDNDK